MRYILGYLYNVKVSPQRHLLISKEKVVALEKGNQLNKMSKVNIMSNGRH